MTTMPPPDPSDTPSADANGRAAEPGAAPAAAGPDLAALVGSRLCHDLISPIGAIGNGVELLLLESAEHSPEVTLIAESVAQASARLRYFRIAFGPPATDQRLGRSEVTGLLSDITRGNRLTVAWEAAGDPSRAEAKLVFLAIMACESAMPWGGQVAVRRGSEGTGWRVAGEARRLRFDADLWASLAAGGGAAAFAATLAPGQVHFALLAEAALAGGRRLAVETAETALSLAF